MNGVIRTLECLRDELTQMGHKVLIVHPEDFPGLPCPTYPQIKLAVVAPWRVRRLMDSFKPDIVHLATEGPLCFSIRRYCIIKKWPFTTSYTTHFPDYIWLRFRIPKRISFGENYR
mgnify:FL=1